MRQAKFSLQTVLWTHLVSDEISNSGSSVIITNENNGCLSRVSDGDSSPAANECDWKCMLSTATELQILFFWKELFGSPACFQLHNKKCPAEILGFVGDEWKKYFNKFFGDQTVAAAVFKHVEENEILYTMCYNPSDSWILGLSLGPFFTQRDRKQQQVPKTITQLYSYYIYNILKNHGRETENPCDVLLKLGGMAYTGISKKKIVFRNRDLIEYNLHPSQFLSGFLMELLERDDSAQSVVYTFPHLTIQEFVAALTQFLTPDPGEIGKLLSEAHSKEDGRFEIFLRFVAGLSSPQSARPLEEFLGPFLHQTTCRVIDWVKEKVEGQIGDTETKTGKRKLLNTFHYLFESQNKALARNTVGSVETLSFRELRLTLTDCVVLSHVIGLCDTIKHLDLQQCYIQCEGLQRLGPVLHKCQELSLDRNEVGDSGVKLLSAALRNPECKTRKLEMENNKKNPKNCNIAEELGKITITGDKVFNKVMGLKPANSRGPDGLQSMVLMEVAAEIVDKLVLMFQTSLDSSQIPVDWKQVSVMPRFKKGERQNEDIDGLVKWAEQWRMVFNPENCEMMRFGRSKGTTDYLMNDRTGYSDEQTDFGVLMHRHLKTAEHAYQQRIGIFVSGFRNNSWLKREDCTPEKTADRVNDGMDTRSVISSESKHE
ncbi:NACHT, LRR and PYD domains-containing protein 3-like [Mustelus asterias]